MTRRNTQEQTQEQEQEQTAASGDFGQAEVKQAFDEAQEKGYFGNEVDPTPNSAFSIQSGPTSPTAAEQRSALASKGQDTTDDAQEA